MLFKPKTLLIFLSFASSLLINAQNTQQAITIDDLLALKKVSDVQISPDGKWVAYTVLENDIKKDICCLNSIVADLQKTLCQ